MRFLFFLERVGGRCCVIGCGGCGCGSFNRGCCDCETKMRKKRNEKMISDK